LKELPVKLKDFCLYKRIKYKSLHVAEIAKLLLKILDKHNDESFVIHWTEGPKTGLVAAILVASLRRQQIEGVFCLYGDVGKDRRTQLPIINMNLKESQKKILKAISEAKRRGRRVAGYRIAKECHLGKMTAYRHMEILKKTGFLDEENNPTDTAKVALLNTPYALG